MLRELARSVRHLPDRFLHRMRQKRAARLLALLPDEPTILVVCLGNICRSPYAAARLRTNLMGCGADYVTVESGGFIGPGRPSPNEARESAADRGIDLSDHRSSVIDATVVRMADLVVVMDRRQARRIRGEFPSSHASVLILGDLDPAPIARRAILDPVEQPRRVFDEVYERIDGCVDHAARVMCDQ